MSLDDIKQKGLTKLSVDDIKQLKKENCILLDTRAATIFTQGFIPESISIGLEGRFAEWAGALLPFHENIALITEPGQEEESLIRLTRVGFDQLVGYLDGGFETWKNSGEPIDIIIDIEADEMKMDINYDPKMVIVDVRKELEFDNGHVQTAVNIPLNSMIDVSTLSNFEDTDNIYVHCAGGYRSVIASSLMKRQGIHNLRNVLGGYEQIKLIEGMPLVAAKEVLN
jgi:rhodanese-related sulfurtransferase